MANESMINEKVSTPKAGMFRQHAGAWATLFVIAIAAIVLLWAALFASNNMPDNVGYPLSQEEQAEIIARNSPLATYVYLSPNANFPRTEPATETAR